MSYGPGPIALASKTTDAGMQSRFVRIGITSLGRVEAVLREVSTKSAT